MGNGLKCRECGAENPEYAVHCGTCSSQIRRESSERRRSRIVIGDDWTRFTRLSKTAVKLVLIAMSIVLLLSAFVIYAFVGSSGFVDYTTLEWGLWIGVTAFAVSLLVFALMMIGYSLTSFRNPLKDSRFRIGLTCLVASLLILQYLRP